ncbi:hypothetical protein B0A80_16775 [Flavobacterium tructae]|nr:hypothetical protein B0A80_16775 [Flavobacterium tructae]
MSKKSKPDHDFGLVSKIRFSEYLFISITIWMQSTLSDGRKREYNKYCISFRGYFLGKDILTLYG